MKKRPNWLGFSIIGVEFALAVIIGLELGGYADSKLDMEFPAFTLLGLALGVTVGFLALIRILKRMEKGNGGADEKS